MPSWLKYYQSEQVHIYTDEKSNFYENVNQTSLFSKSNDWKINCKRKMKCIKHHIDNTDHENFVYIDTDCYILNPIDDAFLKSYTIGVTRFEDQDKSLSSGVIFFQRDDSLKILIEQWDKEMNALSNLHLAEQQSLHNICVRNLEKIHNLSPIYNNFVKYETPFNQDEDELKWIELASKDPKVLHFYGITRNRFININKLINKIVN